MFYKSQSCIGQIHPILHCTSFIQTLNTSTVKHGKHDHVLHHLVPFGQCTFQLKSSSTPKLLTSISFSYGLRFSRFFHLRVLHCHRYISKLRINPFDCNKPYFHSLKHRLSANNLLTNQQIFSKQHNFPCIILPTYSRVIII